MREITSYWFDVLREITSYYHIFCCNMLFFACPIIAKSVLVIALRANTGVISVFAPVFNFRYLRSGFKVQGKMMHKDMHKIVFQSN